MVPWTTSAAFLRIAVVPRAVLRARGMRRRCQLLECLATPRSATLAVESMRSDELWHSTFFEHDRGCCLERHR